MFDRLNSIDYKPMVWEPDVRTKLKINTYSQERTLQDTFSKKVNSFISKKKSMCYDNLDNLKNSTTLDPNFLINRNMRIEAVGLMYVADFLSKFL